MESKFKILVVGDVRGRFKQLFQRVENINKKSGPFEILLCVGDFFSEQSKQNEELIAYKNGNKHICVPTYVLGPNHSAAVKCYEDIKDGEICTNLTYLGKRGLYTLTNGIKIAYLSGIENSLNPDEEYHFKRDDIESLRNSCLINKTISGDYRGVDILLTSQWPYGIRDDNTNSSKLISLLCQYVKPRYHFCGLNNTYFEAPPYRFPSDQTTQLELCTRFISLAEVGNANKEKYIYALSLTPVDKMRVLDLIQKTTNEVKCPFANIGFTDFKMNGSNTQNCQFFFDMSSKDGEMNRKRSNAGNDTPRSKKSKVAHWDQEICWFCLSCPNVEKHLIISIGEHFYLALAKGPINEYHILILSITHIPCAAQITDDDWKELNKFKRAIREFFKDQNQVVCFTERNYKSSHLQINVFGVDDGYAWKIPHAFEDKAEEYNLQFEKIMDSVSKQVLPNCGPYFAAELPNSTTLITRQMKHFPIHFARDVFCSENLLNCDEKVDWRACKLDKEKEIELVENFRDKFSKYDFTT